MRRYGLETCGLMVVTQVIVPAAVSFPAAVNNVDELQSALESQAGAGAEVSITSVKTTLSSGFTLPAGRDLDSVKDDLKNQLAAVYNVDPSDVTLDGNRRRLESENADYRRLQTQVVYTISTTGLDSSPTGDNAPSLSGLRAAIANGAGVPMSSLIDVADPATASVETEVEYTVTVTQSAGSDAAAVQAALADTSTLVIPGVDSNEIVVQTEAPVIVSTTMAEDDVPTGVTATAAAPAPPPPPPIIQSPGATPAPAPTPAPVPAPGPAPSTSDSGVASVAMALAALMIATL